MKLSILTACYNKERWIEETAKSVLGQSDRRWEWIVVDDRSTDKSITKLQSVARDNRVAISCNSGRLYCSGTYAKALSMATGDCCAVLDADDILKPNAVANILSLYEKYPQIGYIYTQHDICTVKMQLMRRGVSSLPKPGKSFAEMAQSKAHCFSHWRTFRTKLRDQADIFPQNLKSCVDKNMGFVLEEIASGGFYDEVLYLYRWYLGGNISTAVNNNVRRKNDTQKDRWFKMAAAFRDKRKLKNIITHPVIEVKL